MSFWRSLFTCCVVVVFCMLRRSNLVVGGTSLVQAKHLRRCDTAFDGHRYPLQVTVRFHKTLQNQRKLHLVWAAGSTSAPLVLVRIWLDYIAAEPTDPSEPAFASGQRRFLTFDTLATGRKAMVAAVGPRRACGPRIGPNGGWLAARCGPRGSWPAARFGSRCGWPAAWCDPEGGPKGGWLAAGCGPSTGTT